MSRSSTPVLDLLSRTLVSLVEQGGARSMVVARSCAADVVLKGGVQMSPRKVDGRRIAVKGPRTYDSASTIIALWPRDNLLESKTTKLIYVASGEADLQFTDYFLHCSKGHFILVPPGVPNFSGERSHLEGARRVNGSCDLFNVSGVSGQRVYCWFCHSQGSRHLMPEAGESILVHNEYVLHFLEHMAKKALVSEEGHERICETLLLLLLLTLQNDLEQDRFVDLQPESHEKCYSSSKASPSHASILQAQNYIKSHLQEPLNLSQVAGIVHMSRSKFAQQFRHETGQTFVEFTNQCRLEQAQILLRDTDWSICKIIEFIGLRSLSYFHRLFQQKLGMSALEFRHQSQTIVPGENGKEVQTLQSDFTHQPLNNAKPRK